MRPAVQAQTAPYKTRHKAGRRQSTAETSADSARTASSSKQTAGRRIQTTSNLRRIQKHGIYKTTSAAKLPA